MAIQIGKYKRPGIFIEEIDKSVFSTSVVEGITNLVIGVSKKGPVNTPIRLTNTTDLEAVFGQLDRNLERKGSFFHRTVSKMLETTPVYAMNLLLTDDTLDKIEYKSLSTSSFNKNDIKREGPYRRFFDTTGFWKRDTESFINLTKGDEGYTERALGFTNLSDRYITVFVVKTAVTGFDRTLLEWYGSVEKMPAYVSSSDYASDYMVDVVVVGGDWSNYQELAVDTRWSAYFNTQGLIKEQLRNFANDRNITLLSYYEGLSLIPYFRDLNGRNIFIETTINRDTDTTGLFCAFNAELVEKDFYTGLVDLVGNTLVGTGETEIDFLSYKEIISENVDFKQVPLDLPGNVTSLFGGASFSYYSQPIHAFGSPKETGVVDNVNRTGWFGEGSVYGVSRATSPNFSATQSLSITYGVGASAYAVIGGYVPVGATTSLVINSSDYVNKSTTASYYSAFVLDNTGEIRKVDSFVEATLPTVSSTDIVLGYINVNVQSGLFVGGTFSDVTVSNTGFGDLLIGTDYDVIEVPAPAGFSKSFKVEFLGTNTVSSNTSNYAQYRRFKMFNRLVEIIDSVNKSKVSMLTNSTDFTKYSLVDATITNIVYSTSFNKSFVLNTNIINIDDILKGFLVFYTDDNEFILGTDGVLTTDLIATPTTGVVAKYSNFYSDFYNGNINTGDFFYNNRLYLDNFGVQNTYAYNESTTNVTFINGETATSVTSVYAGHNYIIFDALSFEGEVGLDVLENVIFPTSSLNTGVFTITDNTATAESTSALATSLGYAGSYAYEVVQNVVTENLTNVNVIYDYDVKHYLRMYLDTNANLNVGFRDVTLNSVESINTIAANTIYVQSSKSNLKETIEIELPTGYVQVPNKILVNGSRYTELKVGDFLEADTTDVVLEVGQVARKLTRVLSKRQYAGDTTLSEISCDARILINGYSGDYQATRYSSIDQYATTYKAIAMKGFRIRQASLPDGTEAKQNQVLNLVAKGTPLFKSLINKEAFDFRYLIDSFGLGLVERSKQQLVDICGERLDVFGFLNMPSIRSFKNSSSPSFVDANGVLQVEFIAKGGDPESNPAFLYSFGEGTGTTCVGYFTPYITVNDNGRPFDFPPASYVATTYIRKHISNISSVTPWTIAAGVTNGRVTNIAGLELDFDPTDIEFLNTAQMNPIVLKRNRGYVIETENTALTLYKSALSLVHVREVLIELERELSRMLLDYQWKFNTPDVRAEIKLRADVICETFVSKNGLYNYFNKMDDENNTADVIDNQIGVLDTYVEPIKGMGIIVNNITILRTGAIAAGGFLNA
jgi:hypothetical protein